MRYDPLGPVLAVMPWNFPFWQVFRFAAPALMAGNVAVFKHAANVPGTALAIEEVFRDAGFPEGVFTTLLVPSSRVGELIRHPAVRAVTLTGSDRAGMEVAAEAGGALKKTVLELGGSDPFIVLADADPVAAARQAAKARDHQLRPELHRGQALHRRGADRRRLRGGAGAADGGAGVGDPLDRATEVGPLAREDLLDDLDDQVQRTVEAGAVLRTGGRRLPGPAPSTLRPCSPASSRAWRPSTRRHSDRWRR